MDRFQCHANAQLAMTITNNKLKQQRRPWKYCNEMINVSFCAQPNGIGFGIFAPCTMRCLPSVVLQTSQMPKNKADSSDLVRGINFKR